MEITDCRGFFLSIHGNLIFHPMPYAMLFSDVVYVEFVNKIRPILSTYAISYPRLSRKMSANMKLFVHPARFWYCSV
jgi:hypothetical protein